MLPGAASSGRSNAAAPSLMNRRLATVSGEAGEEGGMGISSVAILLDCQCRMDRGVPWVLCTSAGSSPSIWTSRSCQSKGSFSGMGRLGALCAVLMLAAIWASWVLNVLSDADLDPTRWQSTPARQQTSSQSCCLNLQCHAGTNHLLTAAKIEVALRTHCSWPDDLCDHQNVFTIYKRDYLDDTQHSHILNQSLV